MHSSAVPVVVIVEGDVLLRLVTANNLREAGFEVIEAANCAEAIRILDCIPVDVLFSDLDMPGKIDGIGLAQWVHRSQADTENYTDFGRGKAGGARNMRLSSPSPTPRRMLNI